MADKISVEIALEGGKEVEQQLDSIGKAGQQAFGDIQSAADQVNLGSTTQQFDDLGNAGASAFNKIKTSASSAVAFEQIIGAIGKVQGAFETLGTAAEKVATRMTKHLGAIGVIARTLGPVGIAIGALGGAFVKFGDDAADAFNKLTVSGAKLGLTAQQFDVLQKALGSLGISGDALSGLDKAKENLDKLFSGNFITQLQQFTAQLERMPDSVLRTQTAIATLGDALGGQVIAGLQAGTNGAAQFATALAQVTPATQQQIAQAARYQAAINQLSQAWTDFKEVFMPLVAAVGTPIFQGITTEIKNLKTDIQGLIIDVKNLWGFLQALGGVFTAQGPEQMKAALLRVADAYKQLGTGAQQAGDQAKQGMDAATLAAVNTTLAAEQTTQAVQQTGVAAAQSGQEGASAFNSLTASMNAGIRVILEYQDALRRLAWYQNLPRPTSVIQGLRPDPIGFAGGGMIGGVGTGTSDSNLAWVSRGEHIMPARAVAQPGVLGFLEALRRTGGDLRSVLDGLGRFALGGLVPRGSIPAYATGGPVGGGAHLGTLTLGLPSGGTVTVRATSAVAEQLRKEAALAQVRSGGRKPSRYT